jgi:hypothetical protein
MGVVNASLCSEEDEGAARWQAWWNATCADQSPHRIVVAGKPVCQVPIKQTGDK